MHSDSFDLSLYFRRIGYSGPAAADTATLHALMRHQLFAIPFENLDVQAGKIVSMEPDDIANKLLRLRRGGYCYELNGLFTMALEALGIAWRFVAARPMFYPARRPKTHMAVVAAREVVVGGDELGVAADEGVEIKRERGDEGFAFARGHLGNLALVQGNATDELHVVVDHVPRELMVTDYHRAATQAAGTVFDDGKGLGQNLVKGLPGFQAGAELVRLGAELVIREQLVLLFELVDAGDDGPARFEELTIMAAGKFLEQPGEHEGARP